MDIIKEIIKSDFDKNTLRVLLFLLHNNEKKVSVMYISSELSISERVVYRVLKDFRKRNKNIYSEKCKFNISKWTIRIYQHFYTVLKFEDSVILNDDSTNDEQEKEKENFKINNTDLNGNSEDDILDIFNVWKTTMQKGERTKFDKKRRSYISNALRNYTKEECIKAIVGCSYTPWNMGANPSERKYNDLSLIFRDSERIERFIDNYNKKMNLID